MKDVQGLWLSETSVCVCVVSVCKCKEKGKEIFPSGKRRAGETKEECHFPLIFVCC